MAKANKSKALSIFPLAEILNASFAKNNDRPHVAREVIWASDIGKGMHERFLHMKGTPVSNPPTPEARCKFAMGYAMEDFIKLTLRMVGLLKGYEERVYSDFDFGLKVSGKMDVLCGGEFDLDEMKDILSGLEEFCTFLGNLSNAMKEYARINKNKAYELTGLEIKSTASQIFDRIFATQKPQRFHAQQAFHYAYWKKIPVILIYLDKNNGRFIQFLISPDDKELLKEYIADIVQMSEYFLSDTEPPKEKLLTFDVKFALNWNIQYNSYLTMVYGFETKQKYVDTAKPIADRWNRVLKRMEEGKELTKDNMVAIDEMRRAGYDIGVPETIDVNHEDITEEVVKAKETSSDKLLKLKKILS